MVILKGRKNKYDSEKKKEHPAVQNTIQSKAKLLHFAYN